jgi:hypothetical protein
MSFEQRRLAAAVGADQADLVAAQHGGREVVDQQLVPEAHADVTQLGDDLARRQPGVQLQPHLPEHVAPRRALLAQLQQPRHAADAACAPRLHALAHPHLFLRQQLVGTRRAAGFSLQLAQLGGLEGREVARVAAQHGAVELDDARGHGVDEGAVVRHQHQRAAPLAQQALQPLDGIDVEVVGRLVEQQQLGRGDQRARQRDALLGATRERVDPRLGIELQPLQRLGDALLPGPAAERLEPRLQRVEVVAFGVGLVALAQLARLGHAIGHGIEDAGAGLETRLLRHVDAAQPALQLQLPSSGFSSPARIFSSEDLPAPLRPISAMRSPGSTASAAPSSSGTWP